ncbi:OmpA family protein [Rappaport israeli]|uniref:OmpA family protein n=1 Tax=Rappaport israeli TaxID=1839807 RepID=UPI001E2C8E52|nr:OmpA family protein [Rappaport israeli]
MQQLASELNQRGAEVKEITIVGHTDSVGSEKYNQGLSERRARSVGDYMLENGVPASLIKAYGQGESQPVATNKTAAGRAQNRRVEITVDGQVTVPVEKVVR